ncbi:hypothetical protein FHW69_000485 [Luteibacter sp. Sphag1AF]|uniref:hypothetical protein n=1 Tax=Luteibacter sp. Sphag1AF TaxID=2587031 RepID=UPI00161F53AE|nr:hypothetical protein [Luteibacter sp. Sphag1AF]MBB3225895.1 hypothetical protein [Luteibacter sp. Sphag1AF]
MQPSVPALTFEQTQEINRWLWTFSHELVSNRATTTAGRWSRNVLSLGVRLTVSVGLTSVIRHRITHLLTQCFAEQSSTEQLVATTSTALVPITWTAGALALNWRDGGTTRAARLSRSIALLGGVAALGWAVESDAAEGAAPSLIGNLLYCVLRDLFQVALQAPDNNAALRPAAIAASGVVYGLQQTAGGEISNRFFPSSPPDSTAWNWEGALAGAALNIGLEALDDLMFRSTERAIERHESNGLDPEGLRIRLNAAMPTPASLGRAAVGIAPARAMLLTTAVLGARSTAMQLQNAVMSPELRMSLGNILGNVIVLAGYTILFGQLVRQANRYSLDNEDATELVRPGSLTGYRSRPSHASLPAIASVRAPRSRPHTAIDMPEDAEQHM